jgi:hypothetical protein
MFKNFTVNILLTWRSIMKVRKSMARNITIVSPTNESSVVPLLIIASLSGWAMNYSGCLSLWDFAYAAFYSSEFSSIQRRQIWKSIVVDCPVCHSFFCRVWVKRTAWKFLFSLSVYTQSPDMVPGLLVCYRDAKEAPALWLIYTVSCMVGRTCRSDKTTGLCRRSQCATRIASACELVLNLL